MAGGRRPTAGVRRPRCPDGHAGRVVLNGTRRSSLGGRFEKSRYRCIPADRLERAHDFMEPTAARRRLVLNHPEECRTCGRPYYRGQGDATGWRYAFSIPQVAEALYQVGTGRSYRKASLDLRWEAGRRTHRAARIKDAIPAGPQAVCDYLDAFGALISLALSPDTWPAILLLDSKPVFVANHTACCGTRSPAPAGFTSSGRPRRPKIHHAAPMEEIGAILVAVGLTATGVAPRPWLMRFAGGRDEASWAEFLALLPPQRVQWVVSDRDKAIINAVRGTFPKAVHYYCEQHLASNAADTAKEKDDIGAVAQAMGIHVSEHPLWDVLEDAFLDDQHYLLATAAAGAYGLPETEQWFLDNEDALRAQRAARLPGYPRTAGACEAVIAEMWSAIADRIPHFRNADRLNRLLALVRLDLEKTASAKAYAAVLSDLFEGARGRCNPDWGAIRDPARSDSSMYLLALEADARAKKAKSKRAAPGKARLYRRKKADYEAERERLGMAPPPKGLRASRANKTVAGMTIKDFPHLVAEWHPTLNGGLKPGDVQAGSGTMCWWLCPTGNGHEWQTQARSRSLRGTGCPFCARRRVAEPERLDVAYPDIAAEWHPTRNGDRHASDFSYASHREVWWQCPKYRTHVWRARISSRTSMLSGCSLCRGNARPDAIAASKEEADSAA